MAVSVCTEAYGAMEAARLGLEGAEAAEFAELYACAGLLHDMDYERHPTVEEHPFVGVAHLREQGWPEVVLHAILAHADYSGVKPETHLDKALFACDELAGFLTACALVKPTQVDSRCGGRGREEEDEGQGVCAGGEAGGHYGWGGVAGDSAWTSMWGIVCGRCRNGQVSWDWQELGSKMQARARQRLLRSHRHSTSPSPRPAQLTA